VIAEFIKTVLWNAVWTAGAIFGFVLGTAITDLLGW
jgi:hypothetical protein